MTSSTEPLPAAGGLLRAWNTSTVAGAVALGFAVLVVAFQPIGSPWWVSAPADAGYTASGIALAAGEHTLSPNGMPLQDLMAVTTETRYVAHKLTSEHETPHTYAADRLLHLDDSRLFSRGYAVLFFLAGVLLAFVAVGRLLGRWWGAASALLFAAAPGLPAASIQLQPDVPLAGLVLGTGYLVVRAAERRDARLYTLAAFTLGLAVTVKAQAAGMLLPFAIALAARPPATGTLLDESRRRLQRYRMPLLAFVGIWVLFCATFDRSRVPLRTTHEQASVLWGVGLAALAYAVLVVLAHGTGARRFARGPLRPVGLLVAAALAAGVLLPGTLVLNDLPAMLVGIGRSLRHGGVAGGGSTSWGMLAHTPALSAAVALGLAAVAAGVGLVVRDVQPLLWLSGAATTFALATTHLGSAGNLASAFVLSIPAVLWLARRLPRRPAAVAAATFLAFVLVPTLRDIAKPADAARLQERHAAAFASLGRNLVTRPNQVALTEDLTAVPDVRWHDFVQQAIAWAPAYPFRFLPDSPAGVNTASHLHLAPAYYIGALPTQLAHEQTVPIQFGPYLMRPLPGDAVPSLGIGVAELVAGPGIDRPLEHPDARYDPATGDYRDPAGNHWDLWGNPRSSG